MHHFAHFTGFYDECGLYPFLYGDQMMMNGTDCQQRWDGRQFLIDIFIAQDDIIYSFFYRLLGLFAELIQRFFQAGTPFLGFE